MPARFRASHRSLTIAVLLLFLGSGALASQSRVEIVADEAAVTRPKKISGEHPIYTEMARRAGVQGVVIVESVIDEEGRAEALARVDPKNSVEDLMFIEGLLLQEKAKVTRDPSERQSLFDEAQELLDRSLAPQDTGKAPETPTSNSR